MEPHTEKQYVIVGLGNPGKKYERTRHNLGYLLVQEFAQQHGWKFKEESKFNAKVAKGLIGSTQVHLVLPTTYMNESGRAVRQFLDYYKISARNLMVVVDDIALPFEEMRVRQQGSSGGHNGLKSIAVHLGTTHYARLRMGISRDRPEMNLADYVLDPFSAQETEKLNDLLKRGVQVLNRLAVEDLNLVMNDVNKKRPQEKSEA